jgi:hypothetical protein
MTLNVPVSPHDGEDLLAEVLDDLRELPSRMPVAPPSHSQRLRWELRDIDCYQVWMDDLTVGFIDVVGAVFVSLSGARYDRAVEVKQSLIFERAIEALQDAAPSV